MAEDNLKIGAGLPSIANIIMNALEGIDGAKEAVEKELKKAEAEFAKAEKETTDAEEALDAEAEIGDAEEEIIEDEEGGSSLKIGDFALEYLDDYLYNGVSLIVTDEPYVAQECTYDCCVVFNEDVEEIDGGFFSGNDSIVAAYFLAENVEIGDEAFSNCAGLERIYFKCGEVTLGERAFAGCSNLTEVILPEEVWGANSEVFEGTPWLDENENDFVLVSDTLIKYNGDDSYVEIPEYVYIIGEGAFEDTYVENVKLHENIERIDKNAFRNSDLIEITIPEGVEVISESAFADCSKLEYVKLPESVTEIEDEAFDGCDSLIEVFLPGMDVEISETAFGSNDDFFLKAREGSAVEDYARDNKIPLKVVE